MTNRVQEINYFKGQVSHPNSLSVGAGTFREIMNGWSLRDGIVDKRPGFLIQPDFTKPPGFSTRYTGMRSLNANTFIRQDQGICTYGPSLDTSQKISPELVGNQAFFPLTGADTIDCFQVSAISTDGSKYLAVSKKMTGFDTEPFLMLFSLNTGELLATYADASSITVPNCTGISWRPDGTAFYFSRLDTNKIYKYVVSTGVVTVIAGTGTAGLQTGSTLTSKNIGPINGIKYHFDGTHDLIYACVSNAIYLANLTANSGSIVAGSATAGHVNGTGGSAQFNVPFGVDLFDTAPTVLYVSDSVNAAIRKVTTAGVVTDLLLTGGGTTQGICCQSPKGGSTLTDLIFFVNIGAGNVPTVQTVTTLGVSAFLAGSGSPEYIDGPSFFSTVPGEASFLVPQGICVLQDSIDPNGGSYLSPDVKVFVTDFAACRIRCIDYGPDGCTVSTWAGIGGQTTPLVAGDGFYQKNNLLGFAGGILPPPSNTIDEFPLSNNFDLSGSLPPAEFGFGMFEYNGTTYLNTNRGVVSFDTPNVYSISQIIRYAGAPTGLDLSLSLVSGTLLAATNAVAYRLCWGYKTSSGRTVVGAPSSRNFITASGNKNVQIITYIPPGIDASWSYQLYRTTISTGNVDPGDTEFLVFEASPTPTDLANGFVTITDGTPDALLGADLYTNATQETLSQANTQPPICQDMCLFGSLAIYANTIQKQTMFVNLVGTGGFSGAPTIDFTFADGLNGFTLTGNSSTENAPIGQFAYFTGGTPATNVDNTAQSIIRTINQYTANRRIRAFYISSSNGTPGQIAIVAMFYGCPVFSIDSLSDISVDFSPPLPTSDATWFGPTYASVAETLQNGLYVAKTQNPDAVPLVNNFLVGSSAEPIWRVLPLRTSTIVVKERSIWRLTGDDPSNVTISLLDNTVSLRSPASCSLLNNEVYAITTQGVVAISDNGVRIVSRGVEFQIMQVTGGTQAPMDLVNGAWGFGADEWRMYFLSIMEHNGLPPQTWAYCPLTDAWHQWDLVVYGITSTVGQIVSSVLDDNTRSPLLRGQKPFVISQSPAILIESAMSYADYGGQAQVATLSGKNITLTYSAPQRGWSYGGATTPDVGWVLVSEDGETFYYIIANASGTLTLSDATGLTMGDTIDVWRPINFFLRFNPMTAANPKAGTSTFDSKQWGDFLNALESRNVYQFVMGFLQNSVAENVNFLTQAKLLNQIQPPGPNPDGAPPDGAALYLEQVQRLSIPKGAAVGNAIEWTLQHSEAFSYLVLKAIGAETRDLGSDKAQQ